MEHAMDFAVDWCRRCGASREEIVDGRLPCNQTALAQWRAEKPQREAEAAAELRREMVAGVAARGRQASDDARVRAALEHVLKVAGWVKGGTDATEA